MPCKQCVENKRRSLEKRRQMMAQRKAKLEAACEAGDQMSCITLGRMLQAEEYRATNRYRPELHRRAG